MELQHASPATATADRDFTIHFEQDSILSLENLSEQGNYFRDNFNVNKPGPSSNLWDVARERRRVGGTCLGLCFNGLSNGVTLFQLMSKMAIISLC